MFVPWTPRDGSSVDPSRAHPTELCEPETLRLARPPAACFGAVEPHPALSQAQQEAVELALCALRRHGAFVLGDGTGVGKGRTIAGIASHWRAHHPGARVLWVSANGRLEAQAAEDLAALGLALPDDVAFSSYSKLAIQEKRRETGAQAGNDDAANAAPALVVLDECHCLRNARSQYRAVEALLRRESSPAVVFSSATSMSDPRHLRYLASHLPLAGPGRPFGSEREMLDALAAGGDAALELLALHLRRRGVYVARQLSMRGVEVRTLPVPMDEVALRTHDACAATLREGEADGRVVQRCMFRLLTALKVDAALRFADAELARGHSVIFSLCHTGEAALERALADGALEPGPCAEFSDDPGVALPIACLDRIVDHYGAERVAEITGRKRRFVRRAAGWRVEPVPKGEAAAFQQGAKRVATLTRAGGLGLSLHDTGGGGGRRVNILLELPWSSEEAAQLIGRVHRTAAATAPVYVLPALDLPAEQRVLHTLVKKLRSMGAMTKGDRGACDALGLAACADAPSNAGARRRFALKISALRFARERFADPAALCRVAAENAHAFGLWRHLPPAAAEARYLNVMQVPMHEEDEPLLSLASEFSPEEDKTIFLNAVARFPDTLLPSFVRWAPETHRLFGPKARAWAWQALVVHGLARRSSVLAAVPQAVWFLVVEAALWEGDDAARANSEWPDGASALRRTSLRSHEDFANRVMSLSAEGQRAAARLVRDPTTAQASGSAPPRRDLAELARERAGYGVAVSIAGARVLDDDDGDGASHAVTVDLVADVRGPPPGAVAWEHARTGRLLCVQPGASVGVDLYGREVDFDAADGAYAPAPLARFAAALERRRRAVERKVEAMRREYRVATDGALEAWEGSLRQVVRVPPCAGAPEGLIGLLTAVV